MKLLECIHSVDLRIIHSVEKSLSINQRSGDFTALSLHSCRLLKSQKFVPSPLGRGDCPTEVRHFPALFESITDDTNAAQEKQTRLESEVTNLQGRVFRLHRLIARSTLIRQRESVREKTSKYRDGGNPVVC
jgi:hypothetical protein